MTVSSSQAIGRASHTSGSLSGPRPASRPLRTHGRFKRESAGAQSRLFAGFAPPGVLATRTMAPVVPAVPGLRFQALHTDDAAEAYRLATLRPVRGAFNLAAEPAVDAAQLADILKARRLAVPAGPIRAALSAAWHLRLVPASPHLLDAVLRLPLMDTTRARDELGWSPAHTAREAAEEFLRGLREEAGLPTAPLRPHRFRRVTATTA
jgi:UDP-glucose 4-epimerase